MADRTRIQKIVVPGLDDRVEKKFSARRLQIQDRHLIVVELKAALHVRMAEKSDGKRSFNQAFQSLRRSQHVFILVVHRAVDDREAIDNHRTLRKLFEIFADWRAEVGHASKG